MTVFEPERLTAAIGDYPIIDTHLHLLVHGWLPGAPDFLQRTITASDLYQTLGPAGVSYCGCVEVAQDTDLEIGQLLGFANALKPVLFIVPSVDLRMKPEALRERLEMLAVASGGKFKGVRNLIQDRDDALEFMASEELRAGLKLLGELKLSFDICIRSYKPGQMAGALAMVRACPNTRFILDHCGKPKITSSEVDAEYRTWLQAMAEEANVFMKVSALVDEVDPDLFAQGPDVWKPAVFAHIDAAIDAFGFDRCMWGGDWPVSSGRLTYAENLKIYQEWVQVRKVSGADAARLFAGTAQSAYDLKLPSAF